MITPKEDLKETIARWEGEFQDQPQDRGNYTSDGRLVGTMRGVTPAVLAAHWGLRQSEVTKDIMRSVSLDEAAEIGESRFYRGTGLDLLPWGPATAALVDIGWGSGPRQAVLFAQELAGLRGSDIDGAVGPKTIRAYTNWVRSVGWAAATAAVAARRRLFYERIVASNPSQSIYLKGWTNRANWQEVGTPWFKRWGNVPLPPAVDDLSGDAPSPKPVLTAADAASTKRDTTGGISSTGILTMVGAGAPVVTAASGMDWRLALVFSAAAVLIGAGALIYFLRIRNKQEAS